MTQPRIRDVAALAGVAASTVSVVLNDTAGARVKGSTRERVRAAAEQLGYRPNSVARSLRTQRSQTIAFISDVIATTPYAGQLIQGAQEAAWDEGYLLMLVNTGGDEVLENHAIGALRRQQVDGALYSTMYHRKVQIPELLAGVPVVLLDARPVDGDYSFVVPDEFGGAQTAIEEIISHGHERIAFVLDEREGPAASGRLAGYRETLAAHQLRAEPHWVVRATSNSAGGEYAAGRLLDGPDPPTAIFAFNDQMAIGVYRAAATRSLRIPDDLSVVGFDDLFVISAELSPGLTTMALPHYEMGWEAARLLIVAIEGRGDSDEPAGEDAAGGEPRGEVRLPCPLVQRGSVGPPAAERSK